VGRIRVGVNGYGTIGKRVAWAIMKQPDMELVGVVKTRPSWEALSATARGIRLYVPEGKEELFENAGIRVAGTVQDLLHAIDVVVDATPAGIGATYARRYREAGIKAVFQGGEEESVADVSFNALYTYEAALGKASVRVVSCNTTGILRMLYAFRRAGNVRSVRVTIVRRGADLKEVRKGPIEGLLLKPAKPPSHHAEDVRSVAGRDLDIVTYSIVAPTTLAHMHVMFVRFDSNVSREDIIRAFEETPRTILLEASMASSTSEVRELARDLGRCGDVYEVIVWPESLWVRGNEAGVAYMVHQEAIVVPENIDAIRAVTGIVEDGAQSIRLTDESLGIGGWLP